MADMIRLLVGLFMLCEYSASLHFNFTRGPLPNETGRFLRYRDPVTKFTGDYTYCRICPEKAFTDSTYDYMQDEQCLAHYPDDITDLMTQKEKDNRSFAVCNRGDIPGCGPPPSDGRNNVNFVWDCKPGYSDANTNDSVYSSCVKVCNVTNEEVAQYYCNESLEWALINYRDSECFVPPAEEEEPEKFPWLVFIVVSAVSVVGMVVLIFILWCRRRRNKQKKKRERGGNRDDQEEEMPMIPRENGNPTGLLCPTFEEVVGGPVNNGHVPVAPDNGHVPVAPGNGHVPVAPGNGHVPVAPGNGHVPVAPDNGHVPVAPGNGHVPVAPDNGHVPVAPGNGHVPVAPDNGHVPVAPDNGHVPVAPGNGHVPVAPDNGHVPVAPDNGHVPVAPDNGHVPVEPAQADYEGEGRNYDNDLIIRIQHKTDSGWKDSKRDQYKFLSPQDEMLRILPTDAEIHCLKDVVHEESRISLSKHTEGYFFISLFNTQWKGFYHCDVLSKHHKSRATEIIQLDIEPTIKEVESSTKPVVREKDKSLSHLDPNSFAYKSASSLAHLDDISLKNETIHAYAPGSFQPFTSSLFSSSAVDSGNVEEPENFDPDDNRFNIAAEHIRSGLSSQRVASRLGFNSTSGYGSDRNHAINPLGNFVPMDVNSLDGSKENLDYHGDNITNDDQNDNALLRKETRIDTEDLQHVQDQLRKFYVDDKQVEILPPNDTQVENLPPKDPQPENLPPNDLQPENLILKDPQSEKLLPKDPQSENLPPKDQQPENLPPKDPQPENLLPKDQPGKEVDENFLFLRDSEEDQGAKAKSLSLKVNEKESGKSLNEKQQSESIGHGTLSIPPTLASPNNSDNANNKVKSVNDEQSLSDSVDEEEVKHKLALNSMEDMDNGITDTVLNFQPNPFTNDGVHAVPNLQHHSLPYSISSGNNGTRQNFQLNTNHAGYGNGQNLNPNYFSSDYSVNSEIFGSGANFRPLSSTNLRSATVPNLRPDVVDGKSYLEERQEPEGREATVQVNIEQPYEDTENEEKHNTEPKQVVQSETECASLEENQDYCSGMDLEQVGMVDQQHNVFDQQQGDMVYQERDVDVDQQQNDRGEQQHDDDIGQQQGDMMDQEHDDAVDQQQQYDSKDSAIGEFSNTVDSGDSLDVPRLEMDDFDDDDDDKSDSGDLEV